MQKKLKRAGFTMAELLIVVAIITVLGGVGVVAVQNHQKTMKVVERDAIAKELFIAVQNHLTMAESQGYLEISSFGTDATLSSGVEAGTGTGETGGTGETNGTGEPSATGETAQTTGPVAKRMYVSHSRNTAIASDDILSQMLPFASVDETVRMGGNYIIVYQPNPARVLDVFYCPEGTGLTYNKDLADLGADTQRDARKAHDPIIGWYGGENALEGNNFNISAPTIEVENAERLLVKVTPGAGYNSNPVEMKLIVTSTDSDGTVNAQAFFTLAFAGTRDSASRVASDNSAFTVVLDDITTSGMCFSELNKLDAGCKTGTFIPGSDITVQAVAYSNAALSNVAYSQAITTNSLFAFLEPQEASQEETKAFDTLEEVSLPGTETSTPKVDPNKTALIANFRHLENLDARVSGVQAQTLKITEAKQTKDLVWTGTVGDNAFTAKMEAVKKAKDSTLTTAPVQIYYKSGNTNAYTADDCFLPINLDYPLVYDGGIEAGTAPTTQGGTDGTNARYHSITGVKVAGVADGVAYVNEAGLFGTVSGEVTIRNLELIDFSIFSEKSAGALAGKVTGASGKNVKVENVLARNSSAYDTGKAGAATITSTAGSAGSLIGEMTYCDVNKCAAALVVSGNTNAGGLIGTAGGGSVTASYSGGHTQNGAYYATSTQNNTTTKTAINNVTATNGAAGGLIGVAGTTGNDGVAMGSIANCYSTCSASGNTAAGGLVGTYAGASDSAISGCYATGLVSYTGTEKDSVTIDEKTVAIPKTGAFAYSVTSGTSLTNCHFYDIVNEWKNADGDYMYVTALGSNVSNENITALDATAESYDGFVGAPTGWTAAEPYDAQLKTYYGDGADDDRVAKFNLQSVARLCQTGITETATTDTPADFVAMHYGDWPAPEIFVINTPSNNSNAIDPTNPSP